MLCFYIDYINFNAFLTLSQYTQHFRFFPDFSMLRLNFPHFFRIEILADIFGARHLS